MDDYWPLFWLALLCLICLLATYALSWWLSHGRCVGCRRGFDWFTDAQLVPDRSDAELGKKKWVRSAETGEAQEHERWPARYSFTCPDCTYVTSCSSFGLDTPWLPIESAKPVEARDCPFCRGKGYMALRDRWNEEHPELRAECVMCERKGFLVESEISEIKARLQCRVSQCFMRGGPSSFLMRMLPWYRSSYPSSLLAARS
jgi:hypothetical protein